MRGTPKFGRSTHSAKVAWSLLSSSVQMVRMNLHTRTGSAWTAVSFNAFAAMAEPP